jgi:hypothetical protein
MKQIADLGQYAERFSENDIDFAILEELTDQDLEKIRVSSLGHRQNCCAPLPTSRTSRKAHQRPLVELRRLAGRARRTPPSAAK